MSVKASDRTHEANIGLSSLYHSTCRPGCAKEHKHAKYLCLSTISVRAPRNNHRTWAGPSSEPALMISGPSKRRAASKVVSSTAAGGWWCEPRTAAFMPLSSAIMDVNDCCFAAKKDVSETYPSENMCAEDAAKIASSATCLSSQIMRKYMPLRMSDDSGSRHACGTVTVVQCSSRYLSDWLNVRFLYGSSRGNSSSPCVKSRGGLGEDDSELWPLGLTHFKGLSYPLQTSPRSRHLRHCGLCSSHFW
jgi:hypothetical protein